jgi:hypothetical protein
MDNYLINKALMREDTFEVFVADRRKRILDRVKGILGR